MVMFELVKFSSLSNPLELCLDYFTSQLYQHGDINKDPTVWLNGCVIFYGNVLVHQIFKFIESIGGMLRLFLQKALLARGYQLGSYSLARLSWFLW